MAGAGFAVSEIGSQLEGEVFNLQRCSVHDGPGIRSTVFLKGCPLRCSWCHNPEGMGGGPELLISADLCLDCDACRAVCPIDGEGAAPAGEPWDRDSCRSCAVCVEACPSGAREMAGARYRVDELIELLDRDRPFFAASGGGVTFSGGEPMAQPEFLEAVLRGCRARGLHTAVDTCGFAPRDTVLAVSEIADLILFDLKHMDASAHREFTGVGNRVILENLDLISRSDTEVWIRIPLIPGFNDSGRNVDATGTFLASLPRRHRVFVLPYHAIAEGKAARLGAAGSFSVFENPPNDTLEMVRDRLGNHGLDVAIGGA